MEDQVGQAEFIFRLLNMCLNLIQHCVTTGRLDGGARMLLTLFAALSLFVGTARAECANDTECKGDRICSSGGCVDPSTPPVKATAAEAAGAGRCPWAGEGAPTVEATMTTVTVNGATYAVRGKKAREAFAETLTACNADAGRESLGKWRAARRNANIYGICGPVVLVSAVFMPEFYVAAVFLGLGAGELVAVPIFGVQAKRHREKLVSVIAGSTPPMN